MIRLLNLGPAKHEKVAIYAVNQRISNVCRIAGAVLQRSNSWASVGGKRLFDPNIMFNEGIRKSPSEGRMETNELRRGKSIFRQCG